jgi:hypothetical protein
VRLSEKPTLLIGGSGPTDQQFSYVSGLFRMSDGNIAVANAGSFEVRVFDSTGKHLRSLGRAGAGPGEFQSLYGIYRLRGDSIAAFDTQSQSMTVFAPDGKVGRTFTITGTTGGSRLTPAGLMGNGRDASWLMMSAQNSGALPPGAARLHLFLMRYDQTGKVRDTVARLPGFEVFVFDGGKGRVVPSVLFGRGAAVAATSDGFVVAMTDFYEINRYSSKGRLQSVVRRATPSRSVTSADIDAAREAQAGLFRSPEQKALLKESYLHMNVPATMPAIGSALPGRFPWIVVNEAGGVWVLNYQAPSDTSPVWSIFDREGRLHGTIALPRGFFLHEVGRDYLLGVQTDSLDVEHIAMYGLLRK